MKYEYKENKIGSAMAGSTGSPGQGYAAIWIGVAHYDDGTFEARAKYGWGSNQGRLEEHGNLTTKARAKSITDALAQITPDVLEWEGEIAPAERRAAIRDCQYDAEDWVREHLSKADQISRLEKLIEEIENA